MNKIFCIFVLLSLIGCSNLKHIQQKKIIQRDTVIEKTIQRDTVTVINSEIVERIVYPKDTLILENSLSISKSWIDSIYNGVILRGLIENKKKEWTSRTKIEYIYKTKIDTVYISVPVEDNNKVIEKKNKWINVRNFLCYTGIIGIIWLLIKYSRPICKGFKWILKLLKIIV